MKYSLDIYRLDSREVQLYAESPEDAVKLARAAHPGVLDAADHGVPQQRRRLFILATRSKHPIERHGGAVILERAFTGFTALPAPGQGAKREWWQVLEVDRATVTREGCKQAYRRLASQFHPDKPGGSHEAMTELNAAREAALKEVYR